MAGNNVQVRVVFEGVTDGFVEEIKGGPWGAAAVEERGRRNAVLHISRDELGQVEALMGNPDQWPSVYSAILPPGAAGQSGRVITGPAFTKRNEQRAGALGGTIALGAWPDEVD